MSCSPRALCSCWAQGSQGENRSLRATCYIVMRRNICPAFVFHWASVLAGDAHITSNGTRVVSRASVLAVRCSTCTFNTHALFKLSIRNRLQSDLTDPLLPTVVWLALARPHALSEYLRNQGCRCLFVSKVPCMPPRIDQQTSLQQGHVPLRKHIILSC